MSLSFLAMFFYKMWSMRWSLLLVVLLERLVTVLMKEITEELPVEWCTCIDALGCLNTTEEWYDPKLRPTNPLPYPRHTIKAIMMIHTMGGEAEGEMVPVTKKALESSGFHKDRQVYIIIHDFTSNGQVGWIKHLCGFLLTKCQNGSNVFSVDWEGGAGPPFAQAATNARAVALEIIVLLKEFMKDFGAGPHNFHLIGHGLGAHIAGYVGSAIPGVARITGLDPSGPLFMGMPPIVCLDSTDALFVDVLHTNAVESPYAIGRAQGTCQFSGHLDFYFNGGKNQPGCSISTEYSTLLNLHRDEITPGHIYPGCSHKRSINYFTEALENPTDCQFIGFACPNFKSFLKGQCLECEGNRCALMGMALSPPNLGSPSRFMLLTAKEPPYCMIPYMVDIQLASPDVAKLTVEGILFISMLGKGQDPISMPLTERVSQTMYHGQTYRFLGYHRAPRACPVEKTQIRWQHSSSLCIKCNESLYVKKVVIGCPSIPEQKSTTVALCSCDGREYGEVKNNGTHVFVPCDQLFKAVTSSSNTSIPGRYLSPGTSYCTKVKLIPK